MNKKQAAVRFALLEMVFWSIWASFLSYIVTFGLYKGFSSSFMSITLSIYYVCAFSGQFIWGAVSDKLKTNKKVFLACLLVGWVLMLVEYFVSSELLFALVYGLIGLFMGPMGSMLETWLLKSLQYDPQLYGRSRSMGSIGYAVWILVMGYVIEGIGYYTMPIAASFMIVITLILACITPDAQAPAGTEKREKVSLKDIFSIVKIPIYVLVVLMVFCIGLCISPANNLKILLLQSVGGDVSSQGLDSFIGCFAQFLLFFFAGSISFIHPRVRLLIGSSLVLTAVTIYYFASAPWMIMGGSFLMMGSYGMIIAAAREVVSRNVDFKYQTTANGIVDAFYGSMAGTIALLFAGNIAEAYGIKTMILICLCIGVIPVLLMTGVLLTGKKDHRRKL